MNKLTRFFRVNISVVLLSLSSPDESSLVSFQFFCQQRPPPPLYFDDMLVPITWRYTPSLIFREAFSFEGEGIPHILPKISNEPFLDLQEALF